METLLVQVPDPEGGPPVQVAALAPGERLRFGRGAADCTIDIELPYDDVSRLAGEIRAVDDYWVLSNLSVDKTYVIDNPEGGGEYVTVAPLRLAAPIPFEFARVSLPRTEGPVSFLVFAPQHSFAEPSAFEGLEGERTAAASPLDQTAKYFLVLAALCEPRLRDGASVVLPTAGEIVERLRGRLELTRAAVNHHIDYLAIEKLRVKSRRRAGWTASARRSSRSRCGTGSCATS